MGYTFWFTWSQSLTTSYHFTVPVCLYNTESLRIDAPESISVELIGTFVSLRSIDTETLALHIDASQLHHGKNVYRPTISDLLLHDNIDIKHYTPANIYISCTTQTAV